jgi:hypothetical protein
MRVLYVLNLNKTTSSKKQILGSFSYKRSFTTLPNKFNNSYNGYFCFESLELAYEETKFSLLGVSGIYKLVNKKNPLRFYIGSSVNLARRFNEYIHLTSGIRLPKSSSEIEISQTSASEWILVILEITRPQLSLIHEQYALIKFKPTINKYFNIVPKINPQ